jgi:hypothetical protein
MGRRRFDLDARVVIIFLVVSIPFVAVGAIVVIGLIRSSLRNAIEVSLEQRTLETKLLLERYMADQVVHLRLLAVDPQVREAVAPAAPKKRGNAPTTPAPAGHASPLGSRLREMVGVRPAVQLLQVIDSTGHVVASSRAGSRLDHSDTEWFRALASGHSGAYIGDVRRPPGGSMALLEIEYPIVDPETDKWQGAVQALLDAGDLYGVLGAVRMGRTGHAVLLRGADGVVLASDETKTILSDPFPGYELIRAAVQARQNHWTIPESRERNKNGETVLKRPARLVAYTAVEQVPQVDWTVVVEQDLDEALAPSSSVSRFLWLHFFAAFGSLALLALYISLGLNRPVIERALHLHEEHVPASMRRRRTDREGEAEAAAE